MKNKKNKHILHSNDLNVLGEETHQTFLEIQCTYGIAQRGGSCPAPSSPNHLRRLTSDLNLLSPQEKNRLIFTENIFY